MKEDIYNSLLLAYINLEAEIEIAVRHKLSQSIIQSLIEQKDQIQIKLKLSSILV
jgi:hypothetical protein